MLDSPDQPPNDSREALRREKIPLHPVKLIKKIWQYLIHEHTSPGRLAVAVGMGVFVGCLPIWGFHLPICIALGYLFKLNKLAAWLSANVSNPLFAPFLVFAEIHVGFLVMEGKLGRLTLDELRAMGLREASETFLVNCLVGAGVLGLVLGVACGLLVYVLLLARKRRKERQAGGTPGTPSGESSASRS